MTGRIASRGSSELGSVGVYVLGMHRSGTSATTRVLNLMGLPVCQTGDLVQQLKGNPKGHWESATLVRFNDAILRSWGASWWCPPPLGSHRLDNPFPQALMDMGRRVFHRLHPTRQWVFKDPRNCLTLPFWLRALEERPVAVLVLRSPAEIAASLAERNHFGTALSMALWERSMHHLLPNLRGLPVLVTLYSDLLADPASWCQMSRRFLIAHGAALASRSISGAIEEFLDPSLRHYVVGNEDLDDPSVSPSQRELHDCLLALSGVHHRFEVPRLPVETPWTDRMFAQVRSSYSLTHLPDGVFQRLDDHVDHRQARQTVRSSTVPASVIIINHNEGEWLSRTVSRVRQTVPADVEVVIVDDASSDRSVERIPKDGERLKVVRSSERLGVAGARNLGAQQAAGALLIFSDAHVLPKPGWFEALSMSLDRPGVGAAGPALTSLNRPDVLVYGLTYVDTALNVRWLPREQQGPYPVPLLPGCFLAVRRPVYDLAGGFDDGMLGYGSEDLEFCMRLWRMGYECLVVPVAQVAHRFRARQASEIDWESFLHNLLRLGTLHLGEPALSRLTNALRSQPQFGLATARLLQGDAIRRRHERADQYVYDDRWFFARFGVHAMAAPKKGSGKHDRSPMLESEVS